MSYRISQAFDGHGSMLRKPGGGWPGSKPWALTYLGFFSTTTLSATYELPFM